MIKLPVKIGTSRHDCKYGRESIAIEDTDGNPLVMLDPSEGEYALGCDLLTAEELVRLLNERPL